MIQFIKHKYTRTEEYPNKKTTGERIISALRGTKKLLKTKKDPIYREKEFGIVFKRKYIKNYLMIVKGWKTYAEVAKYYGKTRQYMNMLDNQIVPASSEIMAITANLIGSMKGNWQEPFEIICSGKPESLNHPKFNMAKMDGIVPYNKYSMAAVFRGLDGEVEKSE